MTETVYQLFAKAMSDVKAVKKGERNDHFKFNFRGVDAVVNAVGPALRQHGLFVVPHDMNPDYVEVKTSGNKLSTRITTKNTYRWYGPSGDFFDTVATGESLDTGDKGTSKANSVAFRTCLLQAFTLPTGDPDPDSFSHELSESLIEEQYKHTAGQVERTNNVDALRELWHLADAETQSRIKEKVERLNVEAKARADGAA